MGRVTAIKQQKQSQCLMGDILQGLLSGLDLFFIFNFYLFI